MFISKLCLTGSTLLDNVKLSVVKVKMALLCISEFPKFYKMFDVKHVTVFFERAIHASSTIPFISILKKQLYI